MTLTEKFEKNIDQVNSDFQAIKSKLIECGVEVPDGTKTAELAEKVGEAFDAGKNSEWDAFWEDATRTGVSWQSRFANAVWTDVTFKPRKDIKPAGYANHLFSYSYITDLVGILNERGVVLDTSGITVRSDNMFSNCTLLTRVPYLDLRKATWGNILANMFNNCAKLVSIEGIHLAEDGSQQLDDGSTAFGRCTALEEVRFYGTIADNLNFSWSTKLSKASIISILEALSKDTSDLTLTLSKAAVDAAFYDETNDVIGSESDEWGYAVLSYTNWTISLA